MNQTTWSRHLVTLLGLAVVWVSLVLQSQPAWAEDTPPVDTAPPAIAATELNATDIPSEKVEQFVAAYLSVADLIDHRGEDLQRAETEVESLRLQRAIETEAFDLIQAAGLTRQEYFQLLGLANTDPEFRDRVLAQLEERDD
jgi:hypothetical protein